ncbi:MAG: leucine-rich repeat protein [Anaerovoracaceae bacterium]
MEIKYSVNTDNTITIVEILDPVEIIKIPKTIDGHTVIAIGDDIIPMGTKSKVKSISLPNTIKTIGSYAFNDLRYLKCLSLEEGLEEIAPFGIYTCPDLLEIKIPASIKILGEYSFGYMYEHARSYKQNYFTVICKDGSYAHQYAKENNLTFKLY